MSAPLVKIVSSFVVIAMPLFAVQAEPPAAPSVRAPADPNQRVCEDITTVGSRLGTKRICATRAEWAEKRKRDRETTEEFQRLQGRPCVDAMHGTGVAPAC